MKTLQKILEEIENEIPLECSYEEDARYHWPKRWNELKKRLQAVQHETIVKYPKHNSTEMINYLLVNALRSLDKENRHILTKNLVERDELWKD